MDRIQIKYEDIHEFELEQIQKNYRQYILISGVSLPDSIHRVKKVTETEIENDIYINIESTLNNNYDSGFIYAIRLTDTTDKIYFGADEKLIWEKGSIINGEE